MQGNMNPRLFSEDYHNEILYHISLLDSYNYTDKVEEEN